MSIALEFFHVKRRCLTRTERVSSGHPAYRNDVMEAVVNGVVLVTTLFAYGYLGFVLLNPNRF